MVIGKILTSRFLDLFSVIALETLDVTPHLHQMSPIEVTSSDAELTGVLL